MLSFAVLISSFLRVPVTKSSFSLISSKGSSLIEGESKEGLSMGWLEREAARERLQPLDPNILHSSNCVQSSSSLIQSTHLRPISILKPTKEGRRERARTLAVLAKMDS